MGSQTEDRPGDAAAREMPPADGLLLDHFTSAGDQEAFAILMKRHGPYILAVCRRLTGHAQDAEDVFQACFLELVRKAPSIRQSHSVAGWLQTVAVRLARKARARRARRQQKEGAGPKKEVNVSSEDITWREVRRVLEEEIALLPEELRAPIILCLFQGQTHEEAAQYLEANPRTLKDRLRRGRELLRKRLTRRGVTLTVLGALLAGGTTQEAVASALSQTTLHGATALVSKTSLAGIISPAVLGLTGSSSVFAGWGILTVALLGVVLSGSYVFWDRSSPPPVPPPTTKAEAPAGQPKVKRSFRGKQFDRGFFQWYGPNSDRYLRQEEEGLRITLPAADGPAEAIGVKLRYPVRGDFELEALFEFLRVDQPAGGYGAGVNVFFYMDSPGRDGLTLGKMNEPGRGLVFTTCHRVNAEKERITKFLESVPSQQETGLARVRVVRQGDRFSFFPAEGETAAFQHLETLEATAANTRLVRFAADPGWFRNVAVDVRLVDFSMTAEEFVGYDPQKP